MSDIVESIFVHPGELAPHPLNSNIHSKANIKELAEGKRIFGQYKNIVSWTTPVEIEVKNAADESFTMKPGIFYILAGHGLWEAIKSRGDDLIEIKDRSDLSLEESILLMESDNASPFGSRPDVAQMSDNMKKAQGLVIDNERMTAMLDRAKKLHGVVDVANGNGEDTPLKIDKADELRQKWGTETGQLWQLEKHRIICGDCTDKTVVEMMMKGERATFIFTDPPYGVSYVDKNTSLNAVSKGNLIQTPIENDCLSLEETAQKIWRKAFENMFDFSHPGCVYYITMPQGGNQMMMMMMMTSASWLVKHELIWVKNQMVIGRSDYHYKHEPILYGWKPGAAHYFINDRTQTSIWEIDRPNRSDLHPTTKPVKLVERALSNSSKPGDICMDPFLGSGTTLLACHNLHRQCRGVEISPAYIAVCLERFLGHTGIEPKLVSSN